MSTAADDRADRELGRPDVDDLEQEQFTTPAVPVRVTDPVAVQRLPTIGAQARNVALDTVAPVKVLNGDLRRARAVFVADTNAVFLSTSKDALAAGVGFRLPTGVLFEVTSVERWYAIAETDTALLSILNEQWAE